MSRPDGAYARWQEATRTLVGGPSMYLYLRDHTAQPQEASYANA